MTGEVGLADRVAALEQTVMALTAEPDHDAGPEPAPAPAAASSGQAAGARFDSPEEWVNSVYTVLGAGTRLPWCARWWEHADAYERLTWLWKSWEAAVLAQPGDGAAMATWLRDQFDYHRAMLQGRDGPFTDCATGHRTPALPLPTTALAPAADGGAGLDDAARAFLDRQYPAQPHHSTPEQTAALDAARARFLADQPREP